MISLSETTYDSRVLRQIRFLSEWFEISVASPRSASAVKGTHIDFSTRMQRIVRRARSIGFPRWIIFLGRIAIRLLSKVQDGPLSPTPIPKLHSGTRFDLIVCNDLNSLPYGFAHKSADTRIVADLHEWAMDEAPTELAKEIGKSNLKIAEGLLRRCDSVSTVSEAMRRQYLEAFHVDSLVVPSIPEWHQIAPTRDGNPIIELVHHGIYSRHRGIEDLITAFSMLSSKFRLNLMLLRAPEESLRSLARELKIPDDHLVFHQPVLPSALCDYLSNFDIEMIFIPGNSVNHQVGLPNKLFEAVQARLAVVTGPTPELAKAVLASGVGLVTQSFSPEELARTLEGLEREDVSKFKLAADRQAEEWCFENLYPALAQWAGTNYKELSARNPRGRSKQPDWTF